MVAPIWFSSNVCSRKTNPSDGESCSQNEENKVQHIQHGISCPCMAQLKTPVKSPLGKLNVMKGDMPTITVIQFDGCPLLSQDEMLGRKGVVPCSSPSGKSTYMHNITFLLS